MKYILQSAIAILILSAGFISCDNSDKATLINTDKTQSLEPLPQTATKAANIVQAQSAESAPVLNPKHGLPGHRCDIAVGAPLNAAPTAVMPNLNMTQQAKEPAISLPQQQTTTSSIAMPQQQAGQKLNPKHGEPGHRCDIAVGAPLNSPLSNTVAASAPQVAKPAVLAPQQPAPPGLKINPKHGEPGHRCDIAVGAPL
jgi:uncharacterized protein YvpB